MRSSIAISPKKSPFSSMASVVSPSATFFLMATLPDWMMYMSSPSSPSWKRTVPLVKWVRNLAKGFFSAAIVAVAESSRNGGASASGSPSTG